MPQGVCDLYIRAFPIFAWSFSTKCTIRGLWGCRVPSLSRIGGRISRPVCCAFLALWSACCSMRTFGI